jgi:hypothetical protein
MSSFQLDYLPPVKPSAIALGTIFNHAANLAVLTPIFGDTYRKAQRADSKEEFIKSKEAASAATLYGSTLAGSAIQTYAIAALLNHSSVLSYKGAAYIGGLIFAATSVPQLATHIFQERRPAEIVAVKAAVGVVETVGLAVFLTWWGVRPTHDLLR